MSQYKLIIFDLDGTAIPNHPDALPSPQLIKAIAQVKHNIKLCAATGRTIIKAGPIFEQLALSDPCIISGGTQIVDPQTHNILWEVVMLKSDIQEVLEICKPYDYELLFNQDNVGEGSPARDRKAQDDIHVMYLMNVLKKDAQIILNNLDTVKGISASGVTSWTPGLIDIHITHKTATKEHAVEQLLTMLKIQKNETIGVGDADNDVHLFRSVGLKVAMGNATDKLKQQADHVINSIEQDGFAGYIESFIL